MSAVLIAGCGDVGSALARRLLEDGHDVYGLRRRAHLLPEGVHPVEGDLRDSASLRTLPGGLDVLCYTASADGRSPEAYRVAYIDGPRNLLRAVGRESTVSRVMYTSSTRVYAQNNGEWVDEDSPTGGSEEYARLLLEGETAVREAVSSAVVVRFAGIYGPGRTRLIDRVRAGAPCAAAHYSNRIHRDDCAGVLRHLMHLERPAPLYLGADHEPATQCEVMDWIAEQSGLPSLPHAHESAEVTGKRCRNTRLVSGGYQFAHPTFREGYDAMIAGLDPGSGPA